MSVVGRLRNWLTCTQRTPGRLSLTPVKTLAACSHISYSGWFYDHRNKHTPLSCSSQVNLAGYCRSALCQSHHCLITANPQTLPNRILHSARSSASSFNFQHPPFSLRSSSSFLRILPRLPVTSILPCIFPSITCFRSQFLRKMWPIQSAFPPFYVRGIFFSSLTLCNTSILTFFFVSRGWVRPILL